MLELVHDPAVGVNFAVLVIARHRLLGGMQLSATMFRRGYGPESAQVEIEGADAPARLTILKWVLQFFR
jgi:hypothetical protein